MAEADLAQVEAVLLYVSEARLRAERAVRELELSGAELPLVAALKDADTALAELHKRLLQGTYFAVPQSQLLLEQE